MSKLYGYKNLREPFVDHNGNYADYFFLEDPKSVLYGKQNQVPQLPVPDLQHTLELFLRSAKPFCSSAAEFAELETLAAEMLQPNSFTRTLHARLLERAKLAKKNNTSWFVNWWNQWAYLAYRDSIVHNVTYELLVKDESMAQMQNPTRRAARFAYHAMKYRQQVVTGTLPPDVNAKNPDIPWENSQHKYVFNCCRMPGAHSDVSRTYAPDLFPHIVVTYQNRFYKFNVVKDASTQEPVSLEEIHAQLDRIVDLGNNSGKAAAPQVGILTTTQRDTWYENRKVLEIGNTEALEQVQSAVFLIALDLEAKPASRRDVARHMLHGNAHAANRYWDKSFQVVVTGNGKLAFVGEHSMTDGTTTTRLVNYVLDKMFAEKESALGAPDRVESVIAAAPTEITFVSSAKLEQVIAAAWKEQTAMTKQKEFEILMFYGFGADKIKTFGVSPDAFAQVAIQLANRKVFGAPRGTYESTQTRTYMHGRTEVTRSVSLESEAFCDAVYAKGMSKSELYSKLTAACSYHSQYTQQASKANGCDRHMLGLKFAVQEGEKVPALLTHPVTVKSGTWQISTSGLTGELMDGWCFGEVHPDGVGIGYSVQKKRLRFSVTSCHVEEKWAERMCAALEESLVFMANVCEGNAPKPKL